MSVSEMRRQRRAKLAAKQADTIVEQATERVVAARPSPPSSSQEATPEQVRKMRDETGMAWAAIGAALNLPGAKNGAGTARRLYAAANAGVVPRKYAPRKGAKVKPTTPGSAGTVTSRKELLLAQGHVIPRDTPDEDVEAMVRGRTVEWVIDLARLTGTDPATWGPEDKRWVKMEARVAPIAEWVYVGEEDQHGNRLLRFREWLGYDQKDDTPMSGPTRTIRVDSIYTIR